MAKVSRLASAPGRAVHFILVTTLTGIVSWLTFSPPAQAEITPVRDGYWSGGAGLGFLGNTPDGAAEFAFNGHADYFVTPHWSVGPLAQYGGTGNDFMFALSAQGRYWWEIPGTQNLARLVFQGGVGFVRAGIKDQDSGGYANTYGSFLIPIGIGLDYTVTQRLALTADFLLNFTDLGETVRVGGREVDLHTTVMPALYLGVRF